MHKEKMPNLNIGFTNFYTYMQDILIRQDTTLFSIIEKTTIPTLNCEIWRNMIIATLPSPRFAALYRDARILCIVFKHC